MDDPHLDENQHPPDGITLPLNLKKLVISRLCRLETTLEISAVGSAATLRQVIEGKLIQLGHEPRNIQVVVSNVDSSLYIVNDSGIIATEMEHVSTNNMVPESPVRSCAVDELLYETAILRKQLCKAHLKIEGLCIDLSNQNAALDAVRLELEHSECKLAAVDELQEEVATLKKSLKQQTEKTKRFWAQKCEQLLAHEAIVEEKDAKIVSLTAQREVSRVPEVNANSSNDASENRVRSIRGKHRQSWASRQSAPCRFIHWQ